jgi:hypothetical protein
MMIVSFALLCLAPIPPMLIAGDLVAVELVDGRAFEGRVDRRTDEQRLWLRFGSESITVLRPIAWEAVVGARHQGESIDAEQFRRLAEELAAKPQDDGDVAPSTQPSPPQVNPSPVFDGERETDADRARRALGFSARVSAVDFDVYSANWDADVETDGLVLHLYPTDRQGRVINVEGMLEVELLGLPRRDRNAPAHRGQSLRRLAKWTRRVTPDEEGPFQLPFQAIHPEFAPGVGTAGLVHVRLTVPGHGVFESSYDGLQIRGFSPIRDALQAETGRRFLPHERTGRN